MRDPFNLLRGPCPARRGGGEDPPTPVVILLGQSLNQARSTDVNLIANLNDQGLMLTGGASVATWQFWSSGVDGVATYADTASVSEYLETVGQITGCGIGGEIIGGNYDRAYICSVAVGSRSILQLASGGPLCNLYAVVHRLCDHARSDGYAPRVMFYSAHGEQDATNGSTEAEYYERAKAYYRRCQIVAAQAMRQPEYVAPVFLTYPGQQRATNADRAVKEAIRRIAADLPNGVDCGGIYQWPLTSDRIHPTSEANIQRGEFVGKAMRRFVESGITSGPPRITSIVLSGSTFTVTFSEPVVRDTSLGLGENLNAANARDGFEWFDNGVAVAITGLAYSGATVTGTLASVPVGSLSQQVLRIAVQDVTHTAATAASDRPGSAVRADQAGFPSIYNPSYAHYRWAIPQTFTGVGEA